MAILLKHPAYLGDQVFRMNRSNKDGTHKPGYWETSDCETANCLHYLLGWVTTLDPSTDEGQGMLRTIRGLTRWTFREESGGDGLVRFYFEAGQRCFRRHLLPVERDPIFSRLIPGEAPKVMDYDEFQTEMNETVTRIDQNKREV
mgnify:CR=1 FL=1